MRYFHLDCGGEMIGTGQLTMPGHDGPGGKEFVKCQKCSGEGVPILVEEDPGGYHSTMINVDGQEILITNLDQYRGPAKVV